MKAVLLSAGFGKRLLPLTEKMPKPLVPVLNVPIIFLNLLYLKLAGVEEVFINLHHLGSKIKKAVDHRPAILKDLKIRYVEEAHEILGTGGALKNLESQLGNLSEFIVLNADTFSDIAVNKALLLRRENHNPAVMAVLSKVPAGRNYRPIFYSKKTQHLTHVPPEAKEPTDDDHPGLFTGLQVLSPKVLSYLPPKTPSDMIEYGYSRMLKAGEHIRVYPTENHFFDIGSPEGLLQTQVDVLNLLISDTYDDLVKTLFSQLMDSREAVENIWISPSSQISYKATLIPPVVIGAKAVIHDHAVVGPYTVVGENVEILAKTSVRRSLILTDTPKIPEGNHMNTIFTPFHVFDLNRNLFQVTRLKSL